MKGYIHILFFLIFIFEKKYGYAQENNWNFALKKNIDLIEGYFTFESDSFYYVVGRAYDQFPTYEQGINISKVKKTDGSVVQSKYFEEDSTTLEFYTLNKIFVENDNAIFPMFSLNKYGLALYNIDLHTLNVKKLYTINLPSKYNNVFLEDYILNEKFFYLTVTLDNGVEIDKYLVKVDKFNYDTVFIKLQDTGITGVNHLMAFRDGCLVAMSIEGKDLLTAKIKLILYSSEDERIWEYETTSTVANWSCSDLFALSDKEILYISTNPMFNYSKFQVENRFSVMRFDIDTKKSVWHTWWNEPRKPYIYFKGKVIAGFRENEYLLMANDGVIQDTFNYSNGKVVKFNDKGQRLWQKTYFYSNKWAVNNSFNDIIKTRDSSYLIVGSALKAESAWLVKIDEDGNILPIDTTSSIDQINITRDLPEIKIYPNPASHSIIINQGEITDMTYQLIDITGAVVKTIPLPHAHHHVVWDISEVASGTYILAMMQGTTLIGTKQVEVVK